MLTDVLGKKKKHTKEKWVKNKMEGSGKWEEEIRVGQKRRGKKNCKIGGKEGKKKKE